MSDDDFDLLPAEYYAQVILSVRQRVPLLAHPRLARRVMDVLEACPPQPPAALWGYVVMPDQVRIVVGLLGDDRLEAYVQQIRERTTQALLEAIRGTDDLSLDAVLLYNPVWGGAIFQVWQAGYHRQTFWSEYRLSNGLYELGQAPVEAGLVKEPDEWPYKRLGG